MNQDYLVEDLDMHPALTPADTGIEKLASDGIVSQDTVSMFKELLSKFPDLTIYRPDPKKANCYPCSKSVNHLVDECIIYDHKFSYEDVGSVYAWPCTSIGGFRVYSDPPSIIIGKINTAGFGVIPTDNLEETLEADEISTKVIRKIRYHLKGRPAISYMD